MMLSSQGMCPVLGRLLRMVERWVKGWLPVKRQFYRALQVSALLQELTLQLFLADACVDLICQCKQVLKSERFWILRATVCS